MARSISSLAGYGMDYIDDIVAYSTPPPDEASPLRPVNGTVAADAEDDKKVAAKEGCSPEGKENTSVLSEALKMKIKLDARKRKKQALEREASLALQRSSPCRSNASTVTEPLALWMSTMKTSWPWAARWKRTLTTRKSDMRCTETSVTSFGAPSAKVLGSNYPNVLWPRSMMLTPPRKESSMSAFIPMIATRQSL
jgi:hypothetical protein